MPKLGRPPRSERTEQWCFRIPVSLASRFDLVIIDPVTGRVNPNVKQEIFVPILGRLWDAAISGQSTIDISDIVSLIRQRMEPLP